MLHRLSQILSGFRWAAQFDNPAEILITRHLLRRKSPLSLTHRGMNLLIDSRSSDGHVVGDVLLEGMYDPSLSEAGAGRKPFRYLNLGANIGTFDLRVFQLLGASCEGIAVEMNPATFARLVLHLESNHLLSRVRAVNAAVWDTSGEIPVEPEGRDTGQACAPIPNPQSPIPNPQSPIPNPQSPIKHTSCGRCRWFPGASFFRWPLRMVPLIW